MMDAVLFNEGVGVLCHCLQTQGAKSSEQPGFLDLQYAMCFIFTFLAPRILDMAPRFLENLFIPVL